MSPALCFTGAPSQLEALLGPAMDQYKPAITALALAHNYRIAGPAFARIQEPPLLKTTELRPLKTGGDIDLAGKVLAAEVAPIIFLS